MGKHKSEKSKKEKEVKKSKKEKKEKKSKHSKKDYKKSSHKEKDKLRKSLSKSEFIGAGEEDLVHQVVSVSSSSSSKNKSLISDDDYFLKSEHFRVWCVLIRKKSFESLTSEEAHKLFIDEFAKQYNQNELPDMFYKDEIPVEMREAALKTKHKWQFKVSKDEEEKISLVADYVDFKTRHVTEGVWNHMHQLPASASSNSNNVGVTVSSSYNHDSSRNSGDDDKDHKTASRSDTGSASRKYSERDQHNSNTSYNKYGLNSSSRSHGGRDRTSSDVDHTKYHVSTESNSISTSGKRLQQDNEYDERKHKKSQEKKQYRDYADNILDQLPSDRGSDRGSSSSTSASGGGRLLTTQEKQKAVTSSFHAAAREREEDRDGLNMSESVTMGSSGGMNDDTSYEATKARLNKNKDYRNTIKTERVQELMKKEEIKNAHFMSQLLGMGVDLSKGPIKIAPRDH